LNKAEALKVAASRQHSSLSASSLTCCHEQVIEETHVFWKNLKDGKTPPGKLWKGP
jgi:hypothetical protein